LNTGASPLFPARLCTAFAADGVETAWLRPYKAGRPPGTAAPIPGRNRCAV
jgi:hypothetical protein